MDLAADVDFAVAVALAALARQGDGRVRPNAIEAVETLPSLADRAEADAGERQTGITGRVVAVQNVAVTASKKQGGAGADPGQNEKKPNRPWAACG